MFYSRIIFALILGTCITLLSYYLVKAMLLLTSRTGSSETPLNLLFWFLMALSIFINVIFTILCQSTAAIVFVLYSNFLMTMIALSDLLSGRIPWPVLGMGFVMSGYLGVYHNRLAYLFVGGFFCSLAAGLIYLSGQMYKRYRLPQWGPERSVFGFGDVIAAAAIGLVSGPVLGPIIFFGGLILTGIYGVGSALYQKKALYSIQLRLGLFFFLSAVVVNFCVFLSQLR